VVKHRQEWNDHISRMTTDGSVRIVRDKFPKDRSGPRGPLKHGTTGYLWKQADSLRWEMAFRQRDTTNKLQVVILIHVTELYFKAFRSHFVLFWTLYNPIICINLQLATVRLWLRVFVRSLIAGERTNQFTPNLACLYL
jgi:hypothetical protein